MICISTIFHICLSYGCPPLSLHYSPFNDPATTEIYTLSLHDALPISSFARARAKVLVRFQAIPEALAQAFDIDPKKLRSEEHTSELQSHSDLVCRLLLEKKKKKVSSELSV